MEYRHITLKSGRAVKRYKAYCKSCRCNRGYKDKNHLNHNCIQCANKEIGRNNAGIQRSKDTVKKQSLAAIRRYHDSDWAPIDRSKKGYTGVNSTRVYITKNTPEQNKLKHSMKTLLNNKIKRRGINKNYNSTFEILNYTVEELMNHLESKFQEGMSWDNRNSWHIDHIVADCNFNYSSFEDEEFKKSWGLSNLQPLWAEDNLKKGAK